MNFFSRFTPSLSPPEILEQIFVQRHEMARRLMELIRESAETENKHHTLLIGPRGIGKTHMVSLLHHRLRGAEDLKDRLAIAWLKEEEWGIDSFFDLLLRILRALDEEYPGTDLSAKIAGFYEMPRDELEPTAALALKDFLGGRTLLIIVENLDDLFAGLGDEGQKRLRSYLQENSFCTILATAQSLFGAVSLQTSPFYGFFRPWQLEGLTLDEAVELHKNIAQLRDDPELEAFVGTPTGRARLRAVGHLAGGNHRVHIILSEFLNRQSLDELVGPFMEMLDDLTPYYQARMQQLTPSQRKVVEFLCENRGAASQPEIVARCFSSDETVRDALRILIEKGYVTETVIEKDRFFEIHEPLMRLCLEVKRQRSEPIRLFIDFLRLWYSQEELKGKLVGLPAEGMERVYVMQALERWGDAHGEIIKLSHGAYLTSRNKGDLNEALRAAEELIATRGDFGDWLSKADCLIQLGRLTDALPAAWEAVTRAPEEVDTWFVLGWTHYHMNQFSEAVKAFRKSTELDQQNANLWNWRAYAERASENWNAASISFQQVTSLDPTHVKAWLDQAQALIKQKLFDQSLHCVDCALKIEADSELALQLKTFALAWLQRWNDAISVSDTAIEKRPDLSNAWEARGAIMIALNRFGEAHSALDNALELAPSDLQQRSRILGLKGMALQRAGHFIESLAIFDESLKTAPKDAMIWHHRGNTLLMIGRAAEALESYNHAATLAPNHLENRLQQARLSLMLGLHLEATGLFQSLLQHTPSDGTMWLGLADAQLQIGSFTDSVASYDMAIQLGQRGGEIHVIRGTASLLAGERESAIETISSALWNNQADPAGLIRGTVRMFHFLFTMVPDRRLWRASLSDLVRTYDRVNMLPVLGAALTGALALQAGTTIDYAKLLAWRNIWQELAANIPALQVPLHLLGTAVRFLEKRDPRILLKLPAEERVLLQQLIA